MKIEQTQNNLIIKENPGCLWIFGLFFAAFGGLFIYGGLNGFYFFGTQSDWAVALTFLLGLAGIGIGLWVIYQNPINNLEINKPKSSVAITRWGIFGKRVEVFHFDEIERFCLLERGNNQNLTAWDFGLQLIDGEQIAITSLGTHAEDYESKYVYPINVFIGKELSVCQLNFESQDESNDEMS